MGDAHQLAKSNSFHSMDFSIGQMFGSLVCAVAEITTYLRLKSSRKLLFVLDLSMTLGLKNTAAKCFSG